MEGASAYTREGMASLAARNAGYGDAYTAYRAEKWMDGGAKCPYPKPKRKPCPDCAALIGDEKCDTHQRKVKSRSYKISPSTREYVYERDGYSCVECGCPDNLTLDHVVPRSQGGGNGRDNLQTMCETCNQRKGSSTVFRQATLAPS